MPYGNRRGGKIMIKDPKAPATDPQLDKINELIGEREVEEAQLAIIQNAVYSGLLKKGMASGYIGLLMECDDKPSDEMLDLRRQLSEAQAALAS